MIKDRIFITAFAASLVLHVFWLSMVTVVSPPVDAKKTRFSKVAFLGPILERGVFKVGIGPRERTFLEERYFKNINSIETSFSDKVKTAPAAVFRPTPAKGDENRADRERLLDLVEGAVTGHKAEPSSLIE
ncbi:MAG: hypothetical protein WC515_02895 [Candidatus Omnitrophota bacterium]